MRKNSIKNTRINGEVQRELSRIISREIKDPRIAPMTSVVDAVVTSDLKQCKAYISVLGNDEEKEETMKGLNSAVGYIRRELAHSINLRNTPEITFILDDSIEYGVNMSKKIDELNHGGVGMKHFNEQISKAKTIAITGHIHPDGDCIGSCLALKQYIFR